MTLSPTPLFPEILGYTFTEQLYLGSHTVVYRAAYTATQQFVVIKVLRESPSFGELVQFRNHYAIAKNLPIPGIIRPISLEPFGGSYALVMEDWGGVALGQYLKQQSLHLTEVLAIALQLADILNDLAQHRVVHKDIKPANILLHPVSKQVKLIDFSVASLLPRETQEIQSPNVLEGTLAYLAPEQTGRMNRGIDYRTDFYALGVTLYQLLTGTLPFQSDDPLELIHCHLAKAAVSVDQVNPEIPSVVAAIVAKLMAKNAEDRYQSAMGLKYDLQQCLSQWKETGAIVSFELGQRDLSDRFLVPEKLYGRELEVHILLEAFDRVAAGSSELMLIAGFSGIGKTAVVNEVHKPIVRQRGYFIKGKFDQFNRNIPLSAFVQALRDLMGQLLSESDRQLQQWKTQLLEALGESGQVLIEVIPELEQVLGKQPAVPELSGSAAQNRFNLLFQKFIEVFTTADHPLVMFLDDLQWADSASLQLIKLLMNGNGHLLMLGAYRDNEVSPAHPFMITVDELQKTQTVVNLLTLTPLAFADTNRLVADTLNCPEQLAQPLTELIVYKTKGNPFFTTQFLKVLYEDRLITFNQDCRYWECDITQVQARSLTDDVVEFIALQLQKLPDQTQQVLKLAACIGNQFDLTTLAIVSEQSELQVAIALWSALQEGLILPQSQLYKFYLAEVPQTYPVENKTTPSSTTPSYRFLHDRIQQAAYNLIPETDKQQTHLTIGRLLWSDTTKQKDYLFDILNHFSTSTSLITDVGERQAIAQLYLIGCQQAKLSTAYSTAIQYIQIALDFLPEQSWQTDYPFTLQIYQTAAEIAYLNTEFPLAKQWIQTLLQHSQQAIDCIKAYEILVQIYIAQDQQLKAIETGLAALQILGVDLIKRDDWKNHLPDLPRIEDLSDRSAMLNAECLAALRLLMTITPPTHHVKPDLFPAVVLTMVDLCDRAGDSQLAAYVYGIYGLLLCAVIGDLETAHQAGRISQDLLEQYPSCDLRTKVNMLFAVFVCACKQPGRDTLPLLKQGIEVGLDVGDIEYTSYCIMAYFSHLLLLGQPLELIEQSQAGYLSILKQFKQEHCLEYSKIWLQLYHQLINLQPAATQTDEAEILERFETTHNHQCLFAFHLAQLIFCYWLGKFDTAIHHAIAAIANQDAAFGILLTTAHNFYYSLALLATPLKDKSRWATILGNQTQLRQLADHAPCNYLHKHDLVTAEIHRIQGDQAVAIDFYDRAIAGARENGYIQEEALGNELAARFYLAWGKEKVAAGYMQEAYYGYTRWGAKAKVNDLEQRYPDLLCPILEKAQSFDRIAESHCSIHTSVGTNSGTVNTTLDFAAILKASQSLSSTIQLNDLLHQLTQIILQNSGADRCVLILPNVTGEWELKAIATLDNTNLCDIPLQDHADLPTKLIYYVKNTQEVAIIDDCETDLPVLDEYFRQHCPRSVLCLPILNQGYLIGILYLQNQLTCGAFTHDRVETLQLLTSQAAISLENARLYQQVAAYSQTLEAEVERKTQALHQQNQALERALQQVQQTQAQLIHAEKMSSLGQMVAGIAHEINNPVSFIKGNIEHTQSNFEDLVSLLKLYQQDYPKPNTEIVTQSEEIDLNFLMQDTSKILGSMRAGSDRIQQIVLSLRNFARLDEADLKTVDLHDGIESTLLIAQYRCQSSGKQAEIRVIKDYGTLPAVTCYPSQLNQVFLHLLNNAIDAIRENITIDSTPEIRIRTGVTEAGQIQIQIANTHSFIPEAIQTQIFNPFFTTKPVGQGAGLGLSVSYAIIQKHQGTLSVQSHPEVGTEFQITIAQSLASAIF